jgi:hypothetical protein
VNAAVREILVGREHPEVGESSTSFSHGAEVLATATRSWSVLPPTNAAELDTVGNQLEGLRRSLGDLRTALRK